HPPRRRRGRGRRPHQPNNHHPRDPRHPAFQPHRARPSPPRARHHGSRTMTNTPTRRRDLTVALASMTGVAAIVVGVPLLLSLLAGWPLPATVPPPPPMRHTADPVYAPTATFVPPTPAPLP